MLLGGVFVAILALVGLSIAQGFAEDPPTPGLYEVDGNPSCANLYTATVLSGPEGHTGLSALGPLFGLKYDDNPTGNVTNTLTDNDPWVVTNGPQDPNNSVSIFNVVLSGGEGVQFDWSATLGLDAVIVKAQDANAYVYSPEAFGSAGLMAPDGKAISHVEFCYDYELEATKTANAEYTRTYTWEITKGFDGTYDKFIGDPATTHGYEVSVDQTAVDSDWAVSGTITVTNPTPFPVTFGVTDLVGTTPATVDCPTYALAANDGAAGGADEVTCTYTAPLTGAVDGTNTATITSQNPDVLGAVATADYTFGDPTTIVGFPTVDVTDTNGKSWAASGDATWTYDRDFVCPTDTSLYVDGTYSFTHENTATITQTKQSDDATVTVNCYAPVPSKDADTSYTRTYTWEITKDADGTYDGFIGDPAFMHKYKVSVDQTVDESDFVVAGTITVYNPHPTASMSVSLADSVGGTAATLDCGGTLTVPAASSATCGYTANLTTKTNGTNTATVTLNAIDFSASAGYAFGDPTKTVGYPTINVTDTNGETWTASGDDSWTYSRDFTCSTDQADYTDGFDTKDYPNTATITETGQSDDATVTLKCFAPVVDKTVTPGSITFEREWFWEIQKTVVSPYNDAGLDDPQNDSVSFPYGFAGDSWTGYYRVQVNPQATPYEDYYSLDGTITVTNPTGSPGAIAVDLVDIISGGDADVPGTITGCSDSGVTFEGTTVTVPIGVTATCDWTADSTDGLDGDETLNTVTGTFNEIDFVATAEFAFPSTPAEINSTGVVTDTNDTGENVPVLPADVDGYDGVQKFDYDLDFVCPAADSGVYENGVYTTTFPNTAKLTLTDGTELTDDAGVDITCYLPASAEVVKTTTEGGEDIGQFPFTFQLKDPSGTVVETQTLGTGGGTIQFVTELKTVGTWTVTEILPAGWVSTTPTACTFDVAFPASADQTYTCTFDNVEKSRVDLVKLTNGQPTTDMTWTFKLYEGPDGFGGTEVATDSTPPALLDFGNVDLSPLAAYTLCELEVPAGYSSFWQIDTDGDGVGDATVVPYNPNATDDPPEDLGNRCVDIGAGTDIPLVPGTTLHVVVDNQQPGGAPRTPGYWKNWNRCTGGGQQYTADANGGWQAGFWLLEDVLDPNIGGGIVWDDILDDDFVFEIKTCEVAVDILDKRLVGDEGIVADGRKVASDPLHNLATHLLAAQLNFGAGACTTPEVLDAALQAETLLDQYNFDGNGHDKLSKKSDDAKVANDLATYLDEYNNGMYCGDGID